MKKNIFRILLFIFFFVSSFQIGCFTDESSGNDDSIIITSVSPSSAVAGVATTFQVSGSYSLASKDSGEIHIGFNDNLSYGVDTFPIVDDAIVSKGSGTFTFTVEVIPVNWGSEGNFQCYVNLSEYPHDDYWIPLKNDTFIINITAKKSIKSNNISIKNSLITQKRCSSGGNGNELCH